MLGNIAMRDLPQRMHAGVGAARAMNPNRLAADRPDRGLQRALHRRAVVLKLPAAERRAVIFDGEFVAGHQCNDLSRLSLPGLTGNPSLLKDSREDRWIRGSSPRMTVWRSS